MKLRRILFLAIFAALLLILSSEGFSQTCENPRRPNAGRLCARLRIEQGRFEIRPDDAVLGRGTLPATITKADVIASIRSVLLSTDFPYRFGLQDDARKSDDTQPTPERAELRKFTGTWTAYAEAALATGIDVDLLLEKVTGRFGALRATAPFTLVENLQDLFNGETGDVQFDVVAFTANTPIRVAGAGTSTKRRASIENYLSPLHDRLWEKPVLVGRLKEYYSYLGLEPTIEADPSIGAIEVVEGKRVQQINLPAVGDSPGEIDEHERTKALYAVLDDRDFRLVLKKKISGESIGYVRDLERLEGGEPYFFPVRAQIQQLLLGQSNLALSDIPATTRRLPPPWTLNQDYVGIQLVRPTSDARESPAEAPAAADDTGLINPNTTPTSRPVERGLDTLEERKKPARERHNYIGGGVTYKPGQGISVSGIYQRDKLRLLFRDASLGIKVERQSDNTPTGSLNYAADYIFFEKLKRRVSLQFNGSSFTTNNRFLEGTFQDETRAGGLGRIEIEPFRDRGGKLLRFNLEGAAATVTRKVPQQQELKNKLTTLDLGTLFMTETWESLHPSRLTVAPVMRWGLGLLGGTAFTRFGITADGHVQLSRGFEFDSAESLRKASATTPVFELPSLGGAESVRGFQSDEAIAELVWTSQNEFWTPVPFATNLKGGSGDFFRRMVRLAIFGDVGGVRDVHAGSKQGTRGGIGTGLRVRFGPAVLKGDFAYGLGPKVIGGSRGKFYFTLKTNLPF